MTSRDDKIVEEIRRYREAHAASLDYDSRRITEDLQRQELKAGARIVRRQPRRPQAMPKASSAYQAFAADGDR